MRWIIFLFLLISGMQFSVYAQTVAEAEVLFEEGEEFCDDEDYEKAKKVYCQSVNILENCGATNLLLYYQVLFELAEIAEEEEDYYAAVRYMEKAMTVNNDTVKKAIAEDEGVYSPIRVLSDCYAHAGMWEKALPIKHQRLKRKWQNRHSGNFDIVLEDYMHWIENANYYKYAFRILRDLNEEYGEDKYYNYWMGECYYHLGDYDKALVCFEKVNNDFGRAKVYAVKGDITKAIEIQERIVEGDIKDKGHIIYLSGHDSSGKNLSMLANYYIQNGEYDKAISCEEQNEVTTISCLNLGRAYAGKREWSKAIEYATKAYSMNQQESSKALALTDLSHYSFVVNNRRDLQKYVSELFACASAELLSAFQELTYEERSSYIAHYSELLTEQIPMYAYYTSADTLTALTYDASLLMKGALLNSENSVRHVISENRDASLKELWEELCANRFILDKQMEKEASERKLDTDSLQKVICRLEDSLTIKCKEYDDITKNMQLKWLDVQRRLSSQDIAIEFLRIPINNDSVIYAALSLRKDSRMPMMTALFEEKQLKQVSDTLYYQYEGIADLVWKPLRSELQGVKNIYFSPSGALYNIGIEYLPGMEEYNIYRLSSTRELAIKKQMDTGENAVLYGGLDFYAELDTSNVSKGTQLIDSVFVEHANVRDMKLRGAQGYLPETKIEVERISKEFDKANKPCQLFTEKVGTEESFKALSGKKINNLHICTHGFYYSQEDADRIDYDFLQLRGDFQSAEDKSLTRSGLLMAGANHILEGDTLPDNVEDGILTAKEIADIDLRGLDLVVLSACQTGLGDIAQGEGVFGLQRGFKKAGANTILMSLWKVDDKATQILMTQFYKNFLSGQSKRQSLFSAQKYLREYDNGKYDDPKYWAAFVLLDGIEWKEGQK